MACEKWTEVPTNFEKQKHNWHDVHSIHESVTEFRTFDIDICPTGDMLANIATKALTPAVQHSILRRVYGDSPELQRQVSGRRGANDDAQHATERSNFVYDQPTSTTSATTTTSTVSVSSDNMPRMCVCGASRCKLQYSMGTA